MALYWSYRSIPELADLDRAQRRRVWTEALQRVNWATWPWFGATLAYITAAAAVATVAGE